jgi:ABC-type dipeptide/oligopeptide/nickel transport system permease component
MLPVLLGTTFILFAAVFALPGDPIQALVGPNQAISPSFAREMTERYGLDQPLWTQYTTYVGNLLQGDLGIDPNGTKVTAIIGASWPVTLKLALTAWVMEGVIGIALGTVAAMRRHRVSDTAILAGTTLLLGVPHFVIAYIAQLVIGVKLHWLPVAGIADGWPRSYFLPALMLAALGLPATVRITRASVLVNSQAEFVDTAVVKGLSPHAVVIRHILRNSLIPVVSLLGLSLGGLLGGAVLIEGIFSLPRLGCQVFQGSKLHNGPVVVGICTLLVLAYLLINLAVDLLYGILDPRTRRG